MTAARYAGFSLTENRWRALILGTSLVILILTVYCLTQGITTIFMHLYYFPIILLAYHYHRKGVVLSAVLGLLYVALVTFFVYPDVGVISEALVRFIVFIGIACVVSFLSETLEKRELECNTIIANSEDGIFVFDLSSQMIAQANFRGADIIGFTPGDLVNATLETIWQDSGERARFFDLIKTGGRARTIEAHLTQKNGGTCTVLLSAGVLSENRVVLTVSDITERECMLTEMRRLAEVRESIISNANVWLMVLDSRGRILEWNRAAEEMSGYPAAEVIGGNKVWKHLYPEKNYRKEITEQITEIIKRDNYLENLQTIIVCKNGTKKTILWNTRGLPDSNGIIRTYIAIGVDITERKRAEKALLESEERYRAFFTTSQDCVFITTADGRWIDLNDAAVELFGYGSRDELMQVDIRDLYADPGERARHVDIIRQKGFTREFPLSLKKKDGTVISTLVTSVIRKDKKGTIIGFQGTVRDITERKRIEEALRTSQQILRTVLDTIPVRVFWKDRDLNYLGCNAPFAQDAGFHEPEELIGKSDYQMGWHEQAELYRIDDRHVIETGKPRMLIEEPQTTPDGRTIWLLTSKTPLHDASGRISGVLGAYIDITERKRAEEEIRRLIERFRTVMDSIDAFVYVADMKTYELLFINKYGKDVWGEIEGKVCWQTIQSGQEGPCPFCTNDRLVDDNGNPTGVYHWEFQNTVNGRWYDCRDSAIRWLDGRLVRIEIATDITGRKQIEEALRESEQKFRDLFENSRDGIVIADIQTRKFVDSNEMFSQMLGYRPEEIKNLGVMDIRPEDGRSHVFEVFEKMARDGLNVAENLPVWRKDGTIFYADISAYPISESNKNYLVGVFRDVTERRQAEELRRHFTEELEQQVRSRTKELETSLEEKVVLLREVHHRVKNNFQIILSLLSLQSRDIGDERFTRAMRESQNRIRAMAFIHETMYTSADLARIDLEPYIKYLTSQLFTLFAVRPTTISLTLDVKNIFVDINTAIPLGLIINELVSNSLMHAFPEGRKGQITISIRDDQTGLTMTYQDNGVGFPADFDWQTTESLGFKLIHVLIDQLNGTIEKEPSEGTRFTFRVMRKTDEQGGLHGNIQPGSGMRKPFHSEVASRSLNPPPLFMMTLLRWAIRQVPSRSSGGQCSRSSGTPACRRSPLQKFPAEVFSDLPF